MQRKGRNDLRNPVLACAAVLAGVCCNFHPVQAGNSKEAVERLGQTHKILVNDLGNRTHNRIAVTPDGNKLVINRDISVERFSGVTVVDLETGEISSLLLPEEGRSNGLAIDPPGDRAYVAHTKTSGSIETAGRNRVDCIDITTRPPTLERSLVPQPSLSTQGVTDVAVDPEGKRLYVADRGGARVHVFDIERDSPTQFDQLASVQVQGVVTSVSVTPDGSRVYAANRNNGTVACIDASDHTLGGAACGGVDLIPLSFQTGANLTFGAVAPDGKRAYFLYQQAEPCIAVVNIDPDDAAFQQEIPGSPIPTTAESLFSLALNQDGSLLYTVATNKRELLVIDTQNLRQVQRVTLQVNGRPVSVAYRGPVGDLEDSPRYGELYVAHGSRRIPVINPARGAWAPPDPLDTTKTDATADFQNESDCPDPSQVGDPDTGIDQPVEFVRQGNRIIFYRPSEPDEIIREILLQNPDPVTGAFRDYLIREIGTANETAETGSFLQRVGEGAKRLLRRSVQTAVAETITLSTTDYTADFRPRAARFRAEGALASVEGSITAKDQDGDGITEGGSVENLPILGSIDTEVQVFDADGDGQMDYRGIPLFITQDHQSYVPLTDTNGDEVPDSPAWDFDGDGLPDPDLPLFPFVAGPANPEVELKIHFAQFGNGVAGEARVFSQISLFNLDPDNPAEVRIILRNDDGNPLTVVLNDEQVVGEKELVIPAGGLVVLESDGQGPLTAGSVIVCSDRAVAGVILFGGSVGTAGVGVSHVLLNGFVAPMETDLASGLDTGIAVMNLQDSELSLPVGLYDVDNKLLASASLDLPAHGHQALFVDQIEWEVAPAGVLELSSFRGILKAGKGKVAATVIQTRTGEFATQPVAPDFAQVTFGSNALLDAGAFFLATAAEPRLDQKLYFAQFGDGQVGQTNVFSQIVLLNLTDTSANVRLLLKDGNGQPLEIDLNGETVLGQTDFAIPAGSVRVFQTDGLGDLVDGSVIVCSDQALAGVILFGGTAGVAGVGASASISKGFVAPVESDSSRALDTGIAVVNLDGEEEVTLTLSLCAADGTVVATAELQLDPMGHDAQFLSQLQWNVVKGQELDLSGFSGLIKVESSTTIAGTVIQTRSGTFATQPVVPTL